MIKIKIMSEIVLILIQQVLSSTRFELGNEKVLQAQISERFKRFMIEHRREVELSKGNIIDFMAGDIGIEIKLKGSMKQR